MADVKNRTAMIEELADLQRLLSTRTVLFHQLVAEQLGLGPTDHKCLDFAMAAAPEAPITAGRLAEITGLTTGAITGVLDRLERAGYIRRDKDPADRRQVLVRPVPERLGEISRQFEPIGEAWRSFCARYSDEELATLARFTREALSLTGDQIERLKRRQAAEEGATAPLDGVTHGQLDLRGAARVRILETDDAVLFRALWDGAAPRIRTEGGEVRVSGAHGGRLALTSLVPWRLRIRGGAVGLDADLRRLSVEEVALSGGASDVRILLGTPQTTTPVRARGGADKLTVLRPAGVAARVEVRGGASAVTIEQLRLGDVGGPLRWATPDYDRARARYDIEISGGASQLTIGVGPS